MAIPLPEIPDADRTPLVVQLLEVIGQQQQTIQQLRDEIALLKGQKPRPTIQPSTLERAPPRPPEPGRKRPGSDKRPKTQQLAITDEVVVPRPDVPPGSAFKGYEDFVVQDLVLRPRVTRYRRERWRAPDGRTLVAALPPGVVPGRHFGPTLISYILHQYHHQRVTQPLLLGQLRQLGLDISAGQLSALLTEGLQAFHQEKDELLPAALAVSSYVQVDDTTARHQGHNGFCFHIGNDLFASFESADSKSRLSFLEALRGPFTDYVVNEVALAYWRRQELSEALAQALGSGEGPFPDQAAWQAHLARCGVTSERATRIATEGALLGSVVAHGASPGLVVLSDGAGQFDVLVHALCWVHAERPLAKMVPFSEEHRQAIDGVRRRIWELYQGLKAYREAPDPSQRPGLEARFDALCAWRTKFAGLDGVLKELASRKAELLRVLDCPAVPLHNNGSERDIREYVTRRKVSGGTRSAAGRRARDTFCSLKKTCAKLGVNFWAYVQDRVGGQGVVPRLAELLRRRASESCGGGVVTAPA